MPHFGLMSTEDSFKTEEGALLRSRLHIRAGKRRLRQNKISAGIVTLYDALIFGMQWFISSPGRRKGLKIEQSDDLNDDRSVFAVLERSGVVGDVFDFASFDALVERAMNEEMKDFDYKEALEGFDAFMIRLGVMPFDEAALPAEDPKTF